MNGIVDELYRRLEEIIKRRSLNKCRECSFNKKSNIDFRNCDFEGNNAIGDRTILRNVNIGYGSYIADQSVIFQTNIGKFCSIGSRVKIICGNHPTDTFVSTHPSFFSKNPACKFSFVNENLFREVKYTDVEKRKIVSIGNDVWIGDNVSILDGVKIADGTIVAAGAIVAKDTEPFSVVGGVPAKVIKYRFNSEEIEYLNKLQWWNREIEWIRQNAHLFSDVKKLMKSIDLD